MWPYKQDGAIVWYGFREEYETYRNGIEQRIDRLLPVWGRAALLQYDILHTEHGRRRTDFPSLGIGAGVEVGVEVTLCYIRGAEILDRPYPTGEPEATHVVVMNLKYELDNGRSFSAHIYLRPIGYTEPGSQGGRVVWLGSLRVTYDEIRSYGIHLEETPTGKADPEK